ncbi:MAG: hypothetical protein R3C42_07340 [Parvularculaceae bacterium]|nr:hypothetical protein [Parvularculaceae bacterium]
MPSYTWATPRKAFEYYLSYAGRTPADLWRAVNDGHVRVQIKGVEFSGKQIRALLELLHADVQESEREYELPIWMAVNVDDVERALCGALLPDKRRGRPPKRSDQKRREFQWAQSVSGMLGSGEAGSVADAARLLIARGEIDGNSDAAKVKKVVRAFYRIFRRD